VSVGSACGASIRPVVTDPTGLGRLRSQGAGELVFERIVVLTMVSIQLAGSATVTELYVFEMVRVTTSLVSVLVRVNVWEVTVIGANSWPATNSISIEFVAALYRSACGVGAIGLHHRGVKELVPVAPNQPNWSLAETFMYLLPEQDSKLIGIDVAEPTATDPLH
jgi:hypothetical protein